MPRYRLRLRTVKVVMMIRLGWFLFILMTSNVSFAVDSLTANFHAMVVPPTCEVTITSGVTGGEVQFGSINANAVTQVPVSQKEFNFNVNCGAAAGKQLTFTMEAAKHSDTGGYVFADESSTAQHVGFVARMGIGSSCDLTWTNSSCVVMKSGESINVASAGQAVSSQAIWVKAGLSKGDLTGAVTAGTLKATLTFTAAYP